jgi:putative glutamine amidotransferase
MALPLIGLPGRRKTGHDIVGMPTSLLDLELDLYYADYARGILEAGGLPVHLPLDADPAALAERLDAVVLTGGADIDPSRYGAAPETDQFPPEPIRDAFELTLLDAAVQRELPVLGICRGLQLINVAAGGTLHQDVPPHSCFDDPPHQLAHAISVQEGSTLHGLYGDRIEVNSLHHQAVDELGARLRITATADDGTVEGLESTDGRIVAVQWHPEMLATRSTDPVFGWIVEVATRNAG